jgi:hypothetical protein
MAPPRQESLLARRVGVVALRLFAHKTYLVGHGTPKSVSELGRHALIGFDEETPFLRAVRKIFPQWSRGLREGPRGAREPMRIEHPSRQSALNHHVKA